MNRTFGFGKKHCEVCGVELHNVVYKRFGKCFCSEEHMDEYVEEIRQARVQTTHEGHQSGGCCH
ncbi:MAG: hypothetical protein QW057_05080 [Candidatus Bathyarchaeia archaeon]